jgi:GT2 family glycosyltransferase
VLLRRSAFEQVGGFDESFFMYGEDADLCARLRDAGWTVELCPGATFVHVGGGSSRGEGTRLRVELLRSWLRLIAKRDGIARAERARRWLRPALRLAGERDAAAWAASGPVGDLLGRTE